MIILNLTQHAATPEQRAAGVVDHIAPIRDQMREHLTFDDLPTEQVIRRRADKLAEIAAAWVDVQAAEAANLGEVGDDAPTFAVMIGGAPFLMAPLAAALAWRGVKPVFAFSRRESAEGALPDGSVRKVAVFRHLGFVDAI